MARLLVLRKKRTKREQIMDDFAKRYAQAMVVAKTSPHAARMAAVGAKTYATTRWSTAPKRSKARLFVIPVAVVGGVVVARKVRSNGSSNGHNPDFDRPLGPVATADTVSPPADAAAEAAHKAEAQAEAAETTETAETSS
ncbi:MAG TPA: hypothetical protein VH834_06865 [Solirubrobacteraceae bacterium]|jgi:hypothetical protein